MGCVLDVFCFLHVLVYQCCNDQCRLKGHMGHVGFDMIRNESEQHAISYGDKLSPPT